MPCYQVNMVSVEFKAQSREHLEAALKQLGWQFDDLGSQIRVNYGAMRIDLDSERVRLPDTQAAYRSLNQLKVAYSQQVIQTKARKHRWVLKQRAANKFEARRY